jgi:hypothetical protein
MKTYTHTQVGTVIWVSMAAGAALFLGLGLLFFKPLLAAAPIFVIAGWLFHSLRIEVTETEVRWRFGPGLVRKSVPRGEITSAQPVRTSFIEGWGIHASRFGWLYNVSGYDAVAITLRDGRQFALGTDEPQELAAALREK